MGALEGLNPLNWKNWVAPFGATYIGNDKEDGSMLPPYYNSVIQRGNDTLAKRWMKGNTVYSKYFETPDEKTQRLWREGTVRNTEKEIGQPYPEQMKRWTDLAGLRKNRALESYDEETLNPLLTDFKEKAYSQWGGLNNSQSVLGFDKLMDDRDKYRQQLAEDYDANIENYGRQADADKYTLLNYLNGGLASDSALMSGLLNQVNAFGDNANAWGQQHYKNALASDAQASQNTNQMLGGLMSAAALASLLIPGGQAVAPLLGAASSLPTSWSKPSISGRYATY
jgi:hypothetical protein